MFTELKQKNEELMKKEMKERVDRVKSFPPTIGIALNRTCNVSCVFCLVGNKNNDMIDWNHLQRMESIFPYLKNVTLSGEEVLLHPDIWEIFEYFSRHGIYVNFFTNGKLLTEEVSKRLVELDIGEMHCSFHGATVATYNSIVKGADFDTIVRQLLYLKKLRIKSSKTIGRLPGPALSFHYVAMRRNIEELPKFLELAAHLGAKSVLVKYMMVFEHNRGLDTYKRSVRRLLSCDMAEKVEILIDGNNTYDLAELMNSYLGCLSQMV